MNESYDFVQKEKHNAVDIRDGWSFVFFSVASEISDFFFILSCLVLSSSHVLALVNNKKSRIRTTKQNNRCQLLHDLDGFRVRCRNGVEIPVRLGYFDSKFSGLPEASDDGQYCGPMAG
jgi:hypothetical protein